MSSCKIGDLVLLYFISHSDEKELGIITDIRIPNISDGIPEEYYGCIYEVFWLKNNDRTFELDKEINRFRAAFLSNYGKFK